MTTGRINQVAAGLTGRGPAKAAGQGLARAAQYGSETSLGFNTGEVSAANGAGVNGSASAPRKGVGQTTYLCGQTSARASSMKAFVLFSVPLYSFHSLRSTAPALRANGRARGCLVARGPAAGT